MPRDNIILKFLGVPFFMKRMKSIIAILLCIATLTTFTACGGNSDISGKVLTMSSGGLEGSYDPAGEAAGSFVEFAKLCLDPLVSFDDKGTLILEAAESYETNDNQTVWTFHLRENGKWSDGSAVIADDFINTIHRALYPDSGSMYSSELYILTGAAESQPKEGETFDPAKLDAVGAKAIDDSTLEFTLTKPCVYFLKLLTLPVFEPSKAGVATRENATWYNDPKTHLTNGPFYLSEFKPEQQIVLKKNTYYHQADKVNFDTVVLKTITDVMASAAAYATGEVDVASGLLDTVINEYEGKPDLTYWNMQTTVFMQFNLQKAPVMQDVRVREAIALALNRQNICTVVGSNLKPSFNYVAKEMVSNSSDKKFSEEVPQLFNEDADRAKQLLADAGYPGGVGFPELTYTYASSTTGSDVAVAIQAQLKDTLGINMKLQSVETGVYYPMRRSGDFEILRNSWTADYTDPINYLAQFVTGAGFASSTTISDADYDRLVEQSNIETDPVKRNQLLHDAERLLVSEKFYIIPVYTSVYVGLRNPKISGVTKNDRDEAMYRFADKAE
jgi:oligopeptide transport system substrate-binding protein